MKLKPNTLRYIQNALKYHEGDCDIITMYNRRYSLNKIALKSIRCFETVETNRLALHEIKDILHMIKSSGTSGIARLCKLYHIKLEAGQSRTMYDISKKVKLVSEFQDLVNYVYKMRNCANIDDQPNDDQFDYLVGCRLFICLVVSLLMTQLYNQTKESE